MSEFTARMAALAQRLLADKGVACVLERRVPGAMSASGDRAPIDMNSPAMGVELPTPGDVERDGVVVRRGTVYLTAVDPAPAPEQTVLINGHRRVIKLAENWAPDGLLIYSKLEVAL